MQKPLAELLRPKSIEEYIGQKHLMGEGGILHTAITTDSLHSMILWGPPGVGKTTLALLIAEVTGANFFMLSAINSGVKDIRDIIEQAKKSEKQAILFIDEIHRFSKSQQDSLLGAVEQGIVTLIGATTENPSFEVISPLLSRCQVYVLQNLTKEELCQIMIHCIEYLQQAMDCTITLQEDEALLRISSGDARKLINAVELVTETLRNNGNNIVITNDIVSKIIQQKLAIYDKKGENHYDIISAFIKSIRGSDPNAAVYWMARMLNAGEDPLFIARRMIILASEDIGNANPNALLLANNCFQAVHHIGMPEARIVLAQTATYLSSSPKSNAAYMAIEEASSWVTKTGNLPVPLHLRNAPTKLMKEIGYGQDYKYAHAYDHNFTEQEFLPVSISGLKLYDPQNNPRENELRKYLKSCWKDKYGYIILWLVGFFSILFSLSAQDIHYSQFYAAPLQLNPALTGTFDGIVRMSLNQKTQWMSVTKPYTTFSATVDAPIFKSNVRRVLLGMGVYFNTDRAGDSKYSSHQTCLSISLTKSLDRRNQNKLHFGFYGGFVQRTVNYATLYFDEQFIDGFFDPNNPISENFGREKFFFFDCGIGTSYSYTPSEKFSFSVGVSASHLNHPNQSLYNNISVLPIKTITHLSTTIRLNKTVFLSPMMFAAFQKQYREIVFGSNLTYILKKNSYTERLAMGFGLFYRWADAVIANTYIEWQNIRFTFSYDINSSTLTRASQVRGGFEFSLSYIYKKPRIYRIGHEPCPFEIL